MKMKKLVLPLLAALLIFSLSLTACTTSYSMDDLDSAKDESYEKGKKEGYEEGYNDGRETGYDVGYEDCKDELQSYYEDDLKTEGQAQYDKGWRDGYDDGWDDGYESAQPEEYDQSYTYDSYDDDYSSSYDTAAVTVYVTYTGSKYHRAGCQYLRESQIAIDLNEAIREGYTACSRCF